MLDDEIVFDGSPDKIDESDLIGIYGSAFKDKIPTENSEENKK